MMKQMNLISSYDSDEGLISTFSDEFNEEDDALLPSSKTKRRFEIASQEKDGPDSIQFRTGRKKKLQVIILCNRSLETVWSIRYNSRPRDS